MAYLNYFNSPLGARVGIKVYDPANTGNSWTASLNPVEIPRTPSNVRKYTRTTNGGAVILGAGEYPTQEIGLTWNQMTTTDFTNLSAFCNIVPLVFVDNRGNGYLGVLTCTSVGQISDVSQDIVAAKFSFLVIAPYNGSTNINQLAVPTLTATLSSTPGVMPNPTTLYVWATVFTNTGESLPGSVLTISNTTTNAAYNIAYTSPTSTYFRKLRLYWSTTNNSTTATMLTDIQNGFPVGSSPSFTIWSGYNAYNTANPPTYGTAFTGYWAGSLWRVGS